MKGAKVVPLVSRYQGADDANDYHRGEGVLSSLRGLV